MACQPVHSFSQWGPTRAMFLLVWPHPTHNPSSHHWRLFDGVKHAAPDADTGSDLCSFVKYCFAEVPLRCNLIWVQCLRQLTDREQTQRLPRATDWSLGTELVSAGLDSTWPHRTRDLFIGLHLCVSVCVCVHLSAHVCTCVLCVCTLAHRGVGLISTTEHSSGVTFSAVPRSNQTRGYMCYLLSAGCWEAWLMRLVSKKLHYRHADPLIRYVTLFIIFPVIGNLVGQTFLSSLPDSESWNNKGAPTATWSCLLLTPQGRSVGHDWMLF